MELGTVELGKRIQQIAGMGNPGDAIKEASLYTVLAWAEAAVLESMSLHLFFRGPDFRTWLRKAAPPMLDEQFQCVLQFCRENGTLVLHFERGDSPAYLLVAARGINGEEWVLASRGVKHHIVYFRAGAEAYDEETSEVVDTISGAIAYIQAFPEMVVPGIPDDLKNPNHFRKVAAKKTVSMSPRLIESDGPCPHYRLGHFRLLSNERFINKKGQVIFVRGTFVKGRAKTVLPPEEA